MKIPESIAPTETKKISRRELLLRLVRGAMAGAALTAGGFVLAACKDKTEPLSPATESTNPPETLVTQEYNSKKELLRAINQLPNSSIKSALLSRVSPLFAEQPPETVELGGTQVNLHSARVSEFIVNQTEVSGNAALSSLDSSVTIEQMNLIEPFFVTVPYLGLAKAEELNAFQKGPDGTPVVPINLPENTGVFHGMTPEITIRHPDSNLVPDSDKLLYQDLQDFVRVKESCTLLVYLVWLSMISEKLHEWGQPTDALVRNAQGQTQKIEMLNVLSVLINEQGGRYVASIDIAGALIAIEAYRDTKMIDNLKKVEIFDQYLEVAHTNNLGNSEVEIISAAFQLAINSPSGEQSFPHVGDINKLP